MPDPLLTKKLVGNGCK